MLFFFFLFYQDNVFVISNLKSKYPVLQLDLRSAYNFFCCCCCSDCHFIYKWQKLLVDIFSSRYRLISDLVVVIVSATCGGIAFACAGQPVCPLSPPFALFILNIFWRLGFIFHLLFFVLNVGISPWHLYIVFSLLLDPLIVQKFISFYFCIFSGYYWILTSRICHWTWRLEFCQWNGASMLSLCLYCLTDSLFWASPSDRFFKIMVLVVPLADSKSWVLMFHILVWSFAVHFWWSYNFLAILCHYDVLNRRLFTHNFNTLYISN